VNIEKELRKADAVFDQQAIPSFAFDFKAEEWDYLAHDERRYAEAVLTYAEGKTIKGVAVKLKGSAGSFQGRDAKPGLTVSFEKYKNAERFQGLAKFHLNNGAQDASLLNEQIAGEMCRAAGVPASRCTHAFVKWQGRDLGLYLLKEAFTRDFLAKFFKDPNGDLYDGGFCHDIDVAMQKDLGDEKVRDNVKDLIGACQEGNPQKRWERVEKIVDVDKFLSFLAMESILSHWDGYNFNRNNYRVYFDATTGKAVFFCHGMDQTFNDPNAPAIRDSGAMVGQAVLSNPAWKAKLPERVREIYENVLKPVDWPGRVVEVGNLVKASLEKKNPQWAKDYQNQINAARDRVAQRIASVGKQLGDVPKPAAFDKNNMLKLVDGWRVENGSGGDVAMDETQIDGKKCLHIRANSASAGSWRKAINLPPGRYRFEADVKTAGVVPTNDGKNRGASLRISGGTGGPEGAEGDSGWKTIHYNIESQGADVVLVAELRGQKGDAWFDRDSLRLVWVK
jgi:spore coat protein H